MSVHRLIQKYVEDSYQDDGGSLDDALLSKPESKPCDTLPPINKFKKIAREVSTQKRWTQDMQIKIADDRKEAFQVSSQSGDGRMEILTFNAAG